MTATSDLDYAGRVAPYGPTAVTWDVFVREVLESEWIEAYRTRRNGTDVLEIPQGEIVFLFDAAPTLKRAPESGDDRVVAFWGHSREPKQRRDRARLAGFLPNPVSWSQAKLDRGHLVAHAAGGDSISTCFRS